MTIQLAETPLGLAWFLALWLFGLGACLGSFMNVVIYRLPENLPLWKPNSRCPRCLHPIRSYDNLPVISWLLFLRGKCRDCKLPIPARYPMVELLVGAVFLAFGVFEGLSQGANLQQRWSLSSLTVWTVYGGHMLLICVLICAAFIRFDGRQPPLRLYVWALLLGIAFHWFAPHLPAELSLGRPPMGQQPLQVALLGFAAGAAIGVCATAAAHPRCGGLAAICEWTLVGQFLGWQGVCWIAISVAILAALRSLAHGSLARIPISGLLTATVILWLLNCGRLTQLTATWMGSAEPWLVSVAALFALAMAATNAGQELFQPTAQPSQPASRNQAHA